MARLIEFFTRTGRAGPRPVRRGRRDAARGGHRARPAAGASASSSSRAGSRVFERGRARPVGRARRPGPGARRPRHGRPGRTAQRSIRRAASCAVGDALAVLPDARRRLGRLRRDRSAVQPPAADDDGRRHARRDAREPPDRLRDGHRLAASTSPTPPTIPTFLDADGRRLRRAAARPPRGPLCGRHRARRLPGRAVPVHRLRSRRAGRPTPGSCPRATSSGTRRGPGCGRTAIRARSSRTSSTSTSSCCARSRRVRRLRRRDSR